MQRDFIWRIEDKRGLGPYNGSIHTRGFRDRTVNPPPHLDKPLNKPGMLSDYVPVELGPNGGIQPPKQLRFGFSYAAQLTAWFGDRETIAREHWEDKGARIAVYKRTETLAILEGKHQLMYFAEGPKLPKTCLPISDLWTKTSDQLEAEARANFEGNTH